MTILENVILTLALSRGIKSPLAEILANCTWAVLKWGIWWAIGGNLRDALGSNQPMMVRAKNVQILTTVDSQEEKGRKVQQVIMIWRGSCFGVKTLLCAQSQDERRNCLNQIRCECQMSEWWQITPHTGLFNIERWYVEGELIHAFFKVYEGCTRIPIGLFTQSIQPANGFELQISKFGKRLTSPPEIYFLLPFTTRWY